jgi:Tfp pilus assembly protein PilP
MRRAKEAAKWLTTLAVLAVWIFSASAQVAPAPKPAPKPKAAAQPDAQKPTKKPKAARAAKPAKVEGQPKEKEVTVQHRRDPFEPLVNKKVAAEGPQNLPPGKAGLLISTVRIDGTVRGPNGMIAIASNPQRSVYFLREGDRVYDGRVERIESDGVVFRQSAKDAFGKVVERMVTKRIYPTTAGD